MRSRTTAFALPVLFFFTGYLLTGTPKVWAVESALPSAIPAGSYALVLKRSSASAHVRSTLHDFDAVASKFNGELVIPSSGALKDVRFHFEFKTEDLKTENFLRDGAMHDIALEVEKYPRAVFDARTVRFVRKDKAGWQFRVTGDFSIHGVKREMTANVKVRKEGDDLISTGKFSLRLSDYKISPPSFPFARVEDEVEVKIRFSFRLDRRARNPK